MFFYFHPASGKNSLMCTTISNCFFLKLSITETKVSLTAISCNFCFKYSISNRRVAVTTSLSHIFAHNPPQSAAVNGAKETKPSVPSIVPFTSHHEIKLQTQFHHLVKRFPQPVLPCGNNGEKSARCLRHLCVCKATA